MKTYIIVLVFLVVNLFSISSCSDFLNLNPESEVSENSFYKNAEDFNTALIGDYSELQGIYNGPILYLAELTTDNAEITWTSPTTDEMQADELNITATNSFVSSVWSSFYKIISNSNNILTRLDDVEISKDLKRQYKGEALFLRGYSYFYLVRLFGKVPIVNVTFRNPGEIKSFDMSRKPIDEVYQNIVEDLTTASNLLDGITNLSKSRASVGAAKTLLGKVYLTRNNFDKALNILKEVIDMNKYSLESNYKILFTNGNEELSESIFEVKYLSGNVGEGNQFSSLFTPPRFDMAIFPNNMQGSGRIVPTTDIANSYEPGDLRREASIADSVLLVDGTYVKDIYGLKFVDFTTGITGDGGINFIPLRYADVLLMYSEALDETDRTNKASSYLNMIRERAGLSGLSGLSKSQFKKALEKERRVEFLLEGHRWFDLVRTSRAREVLNQYFQDNDLNFLLEEHELLMPIPQREIDINPNLSQNPGY